MTDPTNQQVSFTSESLGYMKESGGWGTFLAIVGFVYIGFLVLMGVFANRIFASAGGPGGSFGLIAGAVYICIAIIYFFPVLYLLRFSQEVKKALDRRSTEAMTAALENLKSVFKFMGIFTAIALGLSVLGLLSFGAGVLFR